VYATYSLGRTITFEQPQAEIDRSNQLHVLHCAAPRAGPITNRLEWPTAGALVIHGNQNPARLAHSANGEVAVRGGVIEAPAQSSRSTAPKLSARPPGLPNED